MDAGDQAIVDKKMGKWYGPFHPTCDKSLHGPEAHRATRFRPASIGATISASASRPARALRPLRSGDGFDPLREPFHQLIPAVDVEFGKNWEFNFGAGMGFTQNNERLLLKAILGYRFNFKGTS